MVKFDEVAFGVEWENYILRILVRIIFLLKLIDDFWSPDEHSKFQLLTIFGTLEALQNINRFQ